MSAIRIDTAKAQNIDSATDIVVINKSDGQMLEQLTVIRYAGHYRSNNIEAFVIRDQSGKLKVRSERDLGFANDSEKEAFLAESYVDLRSA